MVLVINKTDIFYICIDKIYGMNLQQLEYIIAVEEKKHFSRAAEKCYVTQATLSMMIQKLEDELKTKIFDRSKQPVKPTDIGIKIIAQAKRIIAETRLLKEIINEEKDNVTGDFRIGIIPTLAPYLLPLFLKDFTVKHPTIKLIISELTTQHITAKLKNNELDAGILATPLNDTYISEHKLFNEKYFLYVNNTEKGFNKQYVLPQNIDITKLWLLEEGHCMRSQILNFCELKKQQQTTDNISYEAGSIETLKNIVDNNFGITILPELATLTLTENQKNRLKYFKPPTPVREISIVTHQNYLKLKLILLLQQSILACIPEEMKLNKKMVVVSI